MTSRPAVGLCRVSTQEQGTSRLSLEWQRQEIERYTESHGYQLLEVIDEVGSGGRSLNHRPALLSAIAKAKSVGGVVMVAKLDRLSRDVHTISGLMAEGVPFVVTELGESVDPTMLHVAAAFAEAERRRISERVKASYEARRQRGEKRFGHSATLSQVANARRHKVMVEDANAYRAVLRELEGLSLRAMARVLNLRRVRSPSGAPWSHRSVSRTLRRLALEGGAAAR